MLGGDSILCIFVRTISQYTESVYGLVAFSGIILNISFLMHFGNSEVSGRDNVLPSLEYPRETVLYAIHSLSETGRNIEVNLLRKDHQV